MPIPWLVILRSKWLYIGMLVAALGVQTLRVGHYRHTAEQWKSNYQVQRKAYNAASAAANAEQKALYAARSAHEREKARLADESNRMAQERARSAVSSYAERMRADRLCARQASPATEDGTPSHRDGQGDLAEYVAVTRNDFEIMVANSIRLDEVRKWGESLIRDGTAQSVDPAFGGEAHSPTVEP